MNWQKRIQIYSVLLCAVLGLARCGVKGDPLPPEKPTELGRGRPTYRRASEEIIIEKHRKRLSAPKDPLDEVDKDSERDDEKE